MTSTIKTIAFVAGRSGGHIVPALTLAQQLINKDLEKGKEPPKILFFSTDTELDRKLMSESTNISYYKPLALSNVPRKNWYRYPIFIYQLVCAFLSSFWLLYRYSPAKLISMGGYISIPVCLAAWCLRMPIELYELNIEPGAATRFLACFSTQVNTVFTETCKLLKAKNCVKTVYPIRFSDADRELLAQARYILGIEPGKKTLVVLGGSQGSHFINTLIQKFVIDFPEKAREIAIVHQAGRKDVHALTHFYKLHDVAAVVFDYRSDAQHIYNAADLIICRAGAGTLFEIAFFKKQAFVIPLETATTKHQIANAHAMAREYPQLFTVFYQKELEANPAFFFNSLVQKF